MADLTALQQYLESMGAEIVLQTTDTRLPPEMAAFLRTTPESPVRFAAGAGAVTRTENTLTVVGAIEADWPLTGLRPAPQPPRTVRVTELSITVTDTATGPAVTGTARGTLNLGTALPVTLASAVVPSVIGTAAAWRLAPAGPAPIQVRDLLALGLGGSAGGPDQILSGLPIRPAALESSGTVSPTDFALTFYPGTDYVPSFAFSVAVPGARWAVIPSVLEFDGATVSGMLRPDGYLITVAGTVTVGGVLLEAAVSLTPDPQWTVKLRPADGGAFPGLAALVGWLAGAPAASSVESGLAGMHLAPPAAGPAAPALDAAVSAVAVGFRVDPPAFVSAQIVTLVRIGALPLEVVLALPALTIKGVLRDGAPVTAVQLLDSLALPSVGVPAALNISDVYFELDFAEPSYVAGITFDDVWTVGPVTLQQLGTVLMYDSDDGLSGMLRAVILLGPSVTVQLTAQYLGPGTGWQFDGSLSTASLDPQIGDLISSLTSTFGITAVPEPLRSLSLRSVTASFATATGDFAFTCAGGFTVAGTAAALEVGIAITHPVETHPAQPPTGQDPQTGAAGYTAAFTGTLTIGSLEFSVDFTSQASGTDVVLAAHWQAPAGNPYLNLGDLAAALGLPAPEIPEGLDLRLTAADLSYDVTAGKLLIAAQSATYGHAVFIALPAAQQGTATATGAAAFLFALAVDHPIDLSNIPLLGEVLGPADGVGVDTIEVVVSGAPIPAATAAAANALIPAGYPRFPLQGTASPVALAVAMRFGEQTIPLALGVAPAPATAPTTAPAPASSATTVGASVRDRGGVTAQPPADSDGTVWFRVQKAFGPITIERVGARYAESALWFVLDASLEAGGLSLALQGASVGSPITGFVPRFELRGLGIAFAEPPLAIGGGFASVPPTGGASFQYDGAAVVSFGDWGALAFGSYAEIDGEPSMFVFLRAAGSFGGPPAFFVTALAAGFGYNSAIRIPAVTEVSRFPLVAGLADPGALGGPAATPATALAALSGGPQPWITHALGQTWLAAGVRFSTFQQLDSTVLLAAEFGESLTVMLLGVSTARFPNSAAQRPYAQIQLQLRAVFQPDAGEFNVSATLTRNSYLIDPACVLTGGFAFYVWFGGNPHAGDFAVVLGGYHPSFSPPAHYPTVPRIGFSWSLDSAIRISGSAYFALTPSAIMAGGSLDVRYHDGNLTAWFTAHADLIVTWSPFHFLASIGLSIGIDYEVNLLFTTTTLHLEAGADLSLWGPPTGGTVTVRLWIVTFTVAFGAPDTPNPPPLAWPAFAALLPAPAASTTFAAAGGLAAAQSAGQARAGQQPAPAWPVRADGFAMSVRNAVPSTRVFLGSTAQTAALTGSQVNVRPMQRTGLTVDQRVTLGQTTGSAQPGEIDLAATGWTVVAVTSNVPKALWGTGTGAALDPGDAQLVTGQLTGLTLSAPAPATGWSGGPINAEQVLGTVQIQPGGGIPLAPNAHPVGPVPARGNAVAAISGQIAGPAASAARHAIYQALLGLGSTLAPDGAVGLFAQNAGTAFAAEPLLAGTAP